MADVFGTAFLVFIGLASGAVISGGVFAFISMIGVIPRLMYRSGTASSSRLYENMVVLGGTVGNIVYLFADDMQKVFLRAGQVQVMESAGGMFLLGCLLQILYGIGAGIFVGSLAMALAEGLRVIPIMIGRVRLEAGLPYVLLSIALGKMAGALYYFAG